MARANLPTAPLQVVNQAWPSRSRRKSLIPPFEAAPAQLEQPSREARAIAVPTPPKLATPWATMDPPSLLLQLRPLRRTPQPIAIPFPRFPGLEFQPLRSQAACPQPKLHRASQPRAEGRQNSTRAAEQVPQHLAVLLSQPRSQIICPLFSECATAEFPLRFLRPRAESARALFRPLRTRAAPRLPNQSAPLLRSVSAPRPPAPHLCPVLYLAKWREIA